MQLRSRIAFCVLFTVITNIQAVDRLVQQRSVNHSSNCDHCLLDAISCISHGINPHKEIDKKLESLEQQVAVLKSVIEKTGKPDGLASLDGSGHIPQKFLPGGYDKLSAYDLAWQSLHMAAAAACRGSTPSGGTGCCENSVLIRNTASKQTCSQICASSIYRNCDAEVSLYGKPGKGTQNGEFIGDFYNYGCGGSANGGSEASVPKDFIFTPSMSYLSFCCCRK